jgi:hypothetical protein
LAFCFTKSQRIITAAIPGGVPADFHLAEFCGTKLRGVYPSRLFLDAGFGALPQILKPNTLWGTGPVALAVLFAGGTIPAGGGGLAGRIREKQDMGM